MPFMPGPPSAPEKKNYVVAGKSYDPTDVLQVGAIVKVTDLDLDETLRHTTNAQGEYIEDILNFPSLYSNGDILKLECEKRGYRQTKIHTVDNVASPGTEQVFDKNTTYVMLVW